MRQGYACWATYKVLLGWEVDTVAGTISLPAHRLDRMDALLEAVWPPHKPMSVGQALASVASQAPVDVPCLMYIPATWSMRLVLSHAGRAPSRRSASHRPESAVSSRHAMTSVPSLTAPSDLGACDACRQGICLVRLDSLRWHPPSFGNSRSRTPSRRIW